MRRQTQRPDAIRPSLSAGLAVIDFFATDRVTQFGQVYANLVRPPRLQAARQERVSAQTLDDVNVGNRLLTLFWKVGAAAPAVAPVAHQIGAYPLRRDRPGHDREVAARDRVRVEL